MVQARKKKPSAEKVLLVRLAEKQSGDEQGVLGERYVFMERIVIDGEFLCELLSSIGEWG